MCESAFILLITKFSQFRKVGLFEHLTVRIPELRRGHLNKVPARVSNNYSKMACNRVSTVKAKGNGGVGGGGYSCTHS